MTSFDEYPSVQIQSLFSNNSESVILGQLGAKSSFHFLGPTRGVVPIGPNGIRGLGKLQSSPLSDAETNTAILSYNYTFNHQGLSSDISCIYDTQSPIRFFPVPDNTRLLTANGSCNEIGQADVLTDVTDFPTANTKATLTFWACKSSSTAEQDLSYQIYLRGRVAYAPEIGNISCTVSPIQPAVFPVIYQSSTGFFSTDSQAPINTSAPANTFSDLVERAINSLGAIIQQGQTIQNNLVVAAVEDLILQNLRQSYYQQNEQFLPLYEAMIRGILVDQVRTASNSSLPLFMVIPQITYLRLVYSMTMISDSPPPASCFRTVDGMLSAKVIGWVAKPVHIAFLMPMTILNLASLIIALVSIARAKRSCHEFDPTDPRPLVLAESSLDYGDDSGWADSVLYRSREVRGCHI